MYHPNELDQQIENLRTLQESYDQIAGAAEAYNTGKVQLAQAISSKGVETSSTESYPEMAEKVNAISQETYQINGGEMYAKQLFGSLETPNYWNLYEVLAQLLSDGRLVNYGGILIAEYYKGYDSLALSGAGAGGAYVVSDKDENGQFKMYTEDTTHTWATEFDGKGNRWVAYCFADEGHEFVIDNTDTNPRSIFIGRKVGTIRSTVAGRVSQIVVPDGNEAGSINLQHAMNWGKSVVIRNINQSSGIAVSLNPIGTSAITEEIYIHTDSFCGGSLVYPFWNKIINYVVFESKENVTGGEIFYGTTSYYTIIKANGSFNVIRKDDYRSATNLKELICYSDYLNLGFASGIGTFKVILNYIDSNDRRSINLIRSTYDSQNGWRGASDVILKENWCKPINISACFNLTEASMFANILQRLKQDEPDCGDGVTITLGSTNLAKLTSAESVQLLDDLTNIYGYTFA